MLTSIGPKKKNAFGVGAVDEAIDVIACWDFNLTPQLVNDLKLTS